MKELISVLLIITGFLIVLGSGYPDLPWAEIIVQGALGICIIILGLLLNKNDGEDDE